MSTGATASAPGTGRAALTGAGALPAVDGPRACRLAGRRALVTGAASGIGAAVAARFVAEGARVLVLDRAWPGVGAVESGSSGPTGGSGAPAATAATAAGAGSDPDTGRGRPGPALTVAADITDERAVRAALDQAAQHLGGLDLLVNCAGIIAYDNVGDIEDASWTRMLDVNLSGTMRMCRAALPLLLAAGAAGRRPAIVNLASVAAFNATADMASYATGKAGVVALTRAIANRYGEHGLRANCVAPGWVRTPMSEAEMAEVAARSGIGIEQAFAALSERIALRRVATPAEIAGCVLFLASDDASFVTGACLTVDGGARMPAAARSV